MYKWKAGLTVHGSKQEYAENKWEFYAPIVTWHSICLSLFLAILSGMYTQHIDFVLAYPQAPIETLYMEVPKCFEVQGSYSLQ